MRQGRKKEDKKLCRPGADMRQSHSKSRQGRSTRRKSRSAVCRMPGMGKGPRKKRISRFGIANPKEIQDRFTQGNAIFKANGTGRHSRERKLIMESCSWQSASPPQQSAQAGKRAVDNSEEKSNNFCTDTIMIKRICHQWKECA